MSTKKTKITNTLTILWEKQSTKLISETHTGKWNQISVLVKQPWYLSSKAAQVGYGNHFPIRNNLVNVASKADVCLPVPASIPDLLCVSAAAGWTSLRSQHSSCSACWEKTEHNTEAERGGNATTSHRQDIAPDFFQPHSPTPTHPQSQTTIVPAFSSSPQGNTTLAGSHPLLVWNLNSPCNQPLTQAQQPSSCCLQQWAFTCGLKPQVTVEAQTTQTCYLAFLHAILFSFRDIRVVLSACQSMMKSLL